MTDNPVERGPADFVEVTPPTIAQFEARDHNLGDLYKQLHARAPNLAEYLRRRAAELNPNISDRESQSRLALELIYLIEKQQSHSPDVMAEIINLENQYSLIFTNDIDNRSVG